MHDEIDDDLTTGWRNAIVVVMLLGLFQTAQSIIWLVECVVEYVR